MESSISVIGELGCLNVVESGPADREAGYVGALTRQIARGDEQAFEKFYDEYSPRLYRLLLVITGGDEEMTREVHQCVMIKAAQKMPVALETEDLLWRWLAQVARNAWKDQLRKRLRESKALESLIEAPAEDDGSADFWPRVQSVIEALPHSERRLVESFYFEDLPHKEISSRTGRTVKAIQCELARIRKKLRKVLSRTDDE